MGYESKGDEYRQDLERRLRDAQQEESRYRRLVDALCGWVWEIDENARYSYASSGVRDILGYDPDELSGLSFYQLMSPEEVQRLSSIINPLLTAHQTIQRIDTTLLNKEGREVNIEMTAVPIFDFDGEYCGYRGIYRDITRRKAVEAALRESEHRFRSLIEQSPVSMAILALDGSYKYVNPAFLKAWGIKPEDEKHLLERNNILHDKELEARGVMPYIREAFAGHVVEIPAIEYETTAASETIGITVTAKSWWVRGHMYPLKDREGNIRDVVLMLEDYSREKRAEESLHKLNRILKTLSAVNQVLVRASDESALLNDVCRIIVGIG